MAHEISNIWGNDGEHITGIHRAITLGIAGAIDAAKAGIITTLYVSFEFPFAFTNAFVVTIKATF